MNTYVNNLISQLLLILTDFFLKRKPTTTLYFVDKLFSQHYLSNLLYAHLTSLSLTRAF